MNAIKHKTVFLLITFLLTVQGVNAAHGQKDDYDEHRVDPTFEGWLTGLKSEAKVKGVSDETLKLALKGVKPLKRVIELDRSQPEFKWTFEKYLNKVVDKRRIKRGRAKLSQNKATLEKIYQQYGVPPQIIVALWGIETDFGRITGGFQVIDALVTLAFDGRRSTYFRRELINALLIIDQGHVSKQDMIGSWAGAMGQTQFMPSTFLSYAVDHNGDGKKDVWKTRNDALASGANYLSQVGWKRNESWGMEVKVPKGMDASYFDQEKMRPMSEWTKLGVKSMSDGSLPDNVSEAALINLDGEEGRYFLIFHNYFVIMDWNKSTSFATSVGLLSEAIRN
ncbi:MAG: lytic murein transglycosylase [Gammaproteobacteria bacterium]|nr:lytic murein transglycosylase [Gammaproteobacteria bacterium]